MSEETVTPIFPAETPSAALGRRADFLASALAGLGAALSILAAIWFFFGFAENDTRPEHLASALLLTLGLFIFAIAPFACVAVFARRAHRHGTKRAHLFWTLLLMLPWIGLGAVAAIYTPLPMAAGLILAGLGLLLSLWAAVSLILDWNAPASNTLSSQQNEMSDAPK